MLNWTVSLYIVRYNVIVYPPCTFSVWQGRHVFQRVFSTPLQRMGTKKKRCLSGEEMNQFASVNHHSVSQNNSSFCIGSCPFVARISLTLCCFTHIAQLRGGTGLSECCASINPIGSSPGLKRLRVGQDLKPFQKAALTIVLYSVIKSKVMLLFTSVHQ